MVSEEAGGVELRLYNLMCWLQFSSPLLCLGMVVLSHGTHARVHMNRDKHPETQCQSPVNLCSQWSNDPDYWGLLCLDPGVADVMLSLSFLSFGPVLVNTISQEWISSIWAQTVTYMITCWCLEVKIQLHWSITQKSALPNCCNDTTIPFYGAKGNIKNSNIKKHFKM